jgi:hypothetical protein
VSIGENAKIKRGQPDERDITLALWRALAFWKA